MINSTQKKALKRLAHELSPVVLLGKKGLTKNVCKEVNAALDAHELIKMKFLESATKVSKGITECICTELGCEIVETKGRTVTIFRRNETKPRIEI